MTRQSDTDNLVADIAGAVKFLQWISPEGPHRIETIASEGKAALKSATFRSGQEPALEEFISARNAMQKRENVYFLSCAPFLDGDSRTKANIRATDVLQTDIDVKVDDGDEAEQLDRMVGALLDEKLRPKGIPVPTAVCFTSGGYQAFWKLAEPIDPALAEELNYSLLFALDGDLGTYDVGHLMRLPFTVNWLNEKKRQRGRKPALAWLFEPANFDKPPVLYRVDDFKMRRRKPGSESANITSALDVTTVGEPEPLPDDLTDIFPGDPKWAQVLMTGENPPDQSYPSRSELVHAFNIRMLSHGMKPGHLLSILTTKDYGISAHVLDQPKPMDYAKRQVARAQAYLGQGGSEADADGKPEIFVLPGRLPFAVSSAEQALIGADVPVYQRYDSVVRVLRLPDGNAEDGIRRANGALIMKPVEAAWLREQFAITARWVKLNVKGKKVACDPPPEAANFYLARAGEWNVPFLQAITQIPTLRVDGTILQQPGYDPSSAILYDPGPVEFPLVPEHPNREQAAEALEILERPFREFCFAAPVDKSVALAAVLTALVRRMFPSAPLFVIEAPVAGTGKSLFCEALGIIAMGHKPAMMSQGKTAEEQEKRLSAVLLAGDPVVVLDNCDRPIEGDFLCSMLTQEWVRPRLLGKTKVLRLPTRNLVLATGNNPEVAGDVTRRTLKCRLDAKVERPDQVQFDFDPRDEAYADRAKLVVAGLTVMRAYIAAGQPQPLDKIGSFEQWNIVREALVWLGRPDPAEAREQIFDDDPRKGELIDLLRLWWKAFEDRPLTLSELAAMHENGGRTGAAEVVTELMAKTRYNVFNTRSIGKYLSTQIDRIAGGLVLKSEKDPSGVKRYRVLEVARLGDVEPSDSRLPF